MKFHPFRLVNGQNLLLHINIANTYLARVKVRGNGSKYIFGDHLSLSVTFALVYYLQARLGACQIGAPQGTPLLK